MSPKVHPTPTHNLLVFSDVHLGSDLVQHTRPAAPALGPAGIRRDRELVALLDWYRVRPRANKPWRLVIAGDFVDFVGMSLPPPESGELSEDEREHGLGNGAEHTIAKLERVGELHASVFQALARFLSEGNVAVIVRGNHDVDFHWPEVQAVFKDLVARHAMPVPAMPVPAMPVPAMPVPAMPVPAMPVPAVAVHAMPVHAMPVHALPTPGSVPPSARRCQSPDENSVANRIEFSDWFYYEEGVVFIEHGHQYDDFCSSEHLLHPVEPSDPRRTWRSLADVLLRNVVRPTRGMSESGHDEATVADYLRFAVQLGFGGMFRLAYRFARAVGMLVSMWRQHIGDAAHWVRDEHDRKMATLAKAKKLSLINLRALAKLQRPPMTHSLFRLLAGVMIDRIAISLAVFGLLVWVLVARWTPTLGIALAAAGSALFVGGWLWRRTRSKIDARQSLRDHAVGVAALFPAAFIVMGHTHVPELRKGEASSATYVNLGAWAEEDTVDGSAPPLPATRTHLVVEHVDGRAVARLLSWDAEKGPRRFLSS